MCRRSKLPQTLSIHTWKCGIPRKCIFESIWWESRRRIEQHIKNANVPSIHERSRISGKSGCVHSAVIKLFNKVKLLSSSRSGLVATKVLIRAQFPELYGACATKFWRNQKNGFIFHRASKNLRRQNGSGGIVAASHVLSVQLIARWFQLRSLHIEATTTYVGKIFLRSMYKRPAMQMTCLPAWIAHGPAPCTMLVFGGIPPFKLCWMITQLAQSC